MSKITDAKIIKGLECCQGGVCAECPFNVFRADCFKRLTVAVITSMYKKCANAVEVVRCRDCKWFYINPDEYVDDCTNAGGCMYPEPDDYCSHGERRDGHACV